MNTVVYCTKCNKPAPYLYKGLCGTCRATPIKDIPQKIKDKYLFNPVVLSKTAVLSETVVLSGTARALCGTKMSKKN